MTCEIVIECTGCGKVTFGNSMFPEEVPDFIVCPVCGVEGKVLSKQLVNKEVVVTIIGKGAKGYGTKKEPKSRIGSTDDF